VPDESNQKADNKCETTSSTKFVQNDLKTKTTIIYWMFEGPGKSKRLISGRKWKLACSSGIFATSNHKSLMRKADHVWIS